MTASALGPAKIGSALNKLIQSLEISGSLARTADRMRGKVAPVMSAGRRPELLHGTWLGHSAHPFFTDFPEGAWMAASFLDLFGPRGSEDAARRLVGFGLLAAAPTIVTGLAEWVQSDGPERQSGFIHGVTSSLATLLYGASYASRRRGNHGPAVAMGLAGGVVATMDGWVGGHLSLARGVGVSHNAFIEFPRDWTPTSLEEDRLTDSGPVRAVVGGLEIVVVRQGGRLFSLSGRCSFRGAPLAEGRVQGDALVCPGHGCRFRLDDGMVLRGPANVPQTPLQARIEGGKVEIRTV